MIHKKKCNWICERTLKSECLLLDSYAVHKNKIHCNGRIFHDFSDYKFVLLSAEEMLRTQDYFKNGQMDKNGLVKFIKDVKKNTKLSDEDAAVLAASK